MDKAQEKTKRPDLFPHLRSRQIAPENLIMLDAIEEQLWKRKMEKVSTLCLLKDINMDEET
jgi:hypothetical protein